MKIYAAVIEWPADLGEPPELILDREQSNLVPRAIEAVSHMCTALASDSRIMRDFRTAFEAHPSNLIDIIADTDGPSITFYEEEVSA